jgi:hypothetical protein
MKLICPKRNDHETLKISKKHLNANIVNFHEKKKKFKIKIAKNHAKKNVKMCR